MVKSGLDFFFFFKLNQPLQSSRWRKTITRSLTLNYPGGKYLHYSVCQITKFMINSEMHPTLKKKKYVTLVGQPRTGISFLVLLADGVSERPYDMQG